MRKFLVLVCLSLVFLCGCSNTIANNVLGTVKVDESDSETIIEEQIEKIDGVYSAVVVIRGKSALIGITVKRGYENEAVDIKAKAAEMARSANSDIISTAVTCNAEITQMIRSLKRF